MWLFLLVTDEKRKHEDAGLLFQVIRQFTPKEASDLGVHFCKSLDDPLTLVEGGHVVDMSSDDWLFDLYAHLDKSGVEVIDLADPESLAGLDALALSVPNPQST